MLGFIVKFNGKTLRAAVPKGVTSVIATRVLLENRDEIYLDFVGMDREKQENMEWIKAGLSEGDEIRIQVAEIEKSSVPEKVKKHDPADIVLQGKLKAYHNLKKELEKKGLI